MCALLFCSQCEPGTKVNLRLGGSFFYEPTGVFDRYGNARNVLLIAGGVGISPIASIFNHLSCHRRRSSNFDCKLALLYSARTESDFIFKV
jgi:ferredoxin-NADP reductase